jgi:hypothetical protein
MNVYCSFGDQWHLNEFCHKTLHGEGKNRQMLPFECAAVWCLSLVIEIMSKLAFRVLATVAVCGFDVLKWATRFYKLTAVTFF